MVSITKGKGDFHSCNDDKESYGEELGIGTIYRADQDARSNAIKAMTYLTKDSQSLRINPEGGGSLRMGQILRGIEYRLLDQLSDLSTMLSGTLVTEIDEVRTLSDPGVPMPVISQVLVGLCAMHQHGSRLYRFKQEVEDFRRLLMAPKHALPGSRERIDVGLQKPDITAGSNGLVHHDLHDSSRSARFSADGLIRAIPCRLVESIT